MNITDLNTVGGRAIIGASAIVATPLTTKWMTAMRPDQLRGYAEACIDGAATSLADAVMALQFAERMESNSAAPDTMPIPIVDSRTREMHWNTNILPR